MAISITYHPAREGNAMRDWCLERSSAVGGPVVAGIEAVHDLDNVDVLVAEGDDGPCGFAHIARQGASLEIVTILATEKSVGTGTVILREIDRRARMLGLGWLMVQTTNDNTDALRFYQRRGFHVSDYRVGGFRDALRRKGIPPDQPVEGVNGIEIRDLIRLSRRL